MKNRPWAICWMTRSSFYSWRAMASRGAKLRLIDEFALRPVQEGQVAACVCRPSGIDLGSSTRLGLLDHRV